MILNEKSGVAWESLLVFDNDGGYYERGDIKEFNTETLLCTMPAYGKHEVAGGFAFVVSSWKQAEKLRDSLPCMYQAFICPYDKQSKLNINETVRDFIERQLRRKDLSTNWDYDD